MPIDPYYSGTVKPMPLPAKARCYYSISNDCDDGGRERKAPYTGRVSRVEETEVKRGKGFLGNEANGQTPIELKAPNGSIKFYVATETFEKIKPTLQAIPFKEYREARLWGLLR